MLLACLQHPAVFLKATSASALLQVSCNNAISNSEHGNAGCFPPRVAVKFLFLFCALCFWPMFPGTFKADGNVAIPSAWPLHILLLGVWLVLMIMTEHCQWTHTRISRLDGAVLPVTTMTPCFLPQSRPKFLLRGDHPALYDYCKIHGQDV